MIQVSGALIFIIGFVVGALLGVLGIIILALKYKGDGGKDGKN